MAETTVAFALGSISFIFAMRNAITKLLEDFHAFERHGEELIPFSVKLEVHSSELQAWQRLWRLRKGSPETLPRAYWGDKCSNVLQLLYLIHKITQNIQARFNEKFGQSLPRASNNYQSRQRFGDIEEIAKQNDYLARYKAEHSALNRAGKAFFVTPFIEKQLEALKNQIELLQHASKCFFLDQHPDVLQRGNEWIETERSAISFRTHFTGFAHESHNMSSALHRVLVAADRYNIELFLNHSQDSFDARERIDNLIQKVQDEAFTFRFSLLKTKAPHNRSVDFCCSEARNDIELNRRYGDHDLDFSTVAEYLLSSATDYQPLRLQASNSTAFWIDRLIRLTSVGTKEKQCLKSFLAASCIASTNLETLRHGNFELRERHRLAYELAEWTELFLRTQWFSDLCSCRLYRSEDDTGLQTVFSAQVTKANHERSYLQAGSETTQPWCRRELIGMHICRLGIVLVEIAFSQPIVDLKSLTSGGIEIRLEHEAEPIVLKRSERNQMVRRTMGHDYAEVVDYCIRQARLPHDIREAEIFAFHVNVVEPLFMHYRDNCDTRKR